MENIEVYKAINAVQKAISKTGILKDKKNDQQGYQFRGIDDVYNALAPLLAEHELVILPRVMSRSANIVMSKSGSPLNFVVVDAEFDFIAVKDGSKHTVRMCGEAMDSGDKATNKAMSAAYKYACLESFSIPTRGDNDADATTHELADVKTNGNGHKANGTNGHANGHSEEPKKTTHSVTDEGGEFATHSVDFIPSEFKENKTKTGAAQFWIKSPSGDAYSTMNKTHGAMMNKAHADAMPLRVIYVEKGKYKNIFSLQDHTGAVV